jgi:hypothetical protein
MANSAALQLLHEAISAACPIHGVSVGRIGDKATWRIDFDAAATGEQKQAAVDVVAAFDVSSKPARSFLARDFFKQLAPADRGRVAIALQAEMNQAVAAADAGGDPKMPLRLIWDTLIAQGDAPISTADPKFAADWQSLADAIGAERAAAIAAELKIA